MNAASYGKLGYMKLKKESTAGVAVKPDVLMEILTEDIEVNFPFESVEAITGSRSKYQRATQAQSGPFEGTIELILDEKTAGHLFVGVLGEDLHTSVVAGVYEMSAFEPKNVLPTFTMDIRRGGKAYVTRFFGVCFTKLELSVDQNRWKAVLTVAAQRVFTNARILTGVSSGVTLALDQTSGITVADTLLVLDKDNPDSQLDTFGVGGIGSERELTTGSAITGTLEANDIVVIKADDIDDEEFQRGRDFIFVGGTEIMVGSGENAMQHLLGRTNTENVAITIENGFEPKWGLTGDDIVDRMPAAMLLKDVQVSGSFGEFHANPKWLDVLRSNEQIGLRFKAYGTKLAANAAVAAAARLESSGAGVVDVLIDGSGIGEGGNDYAILVVQGATTLSVSVVNKLITVTLDVDAADNAVATVAAAIDTALSGVGNATSTGSGNVTAADNPDKVNFAGGLDAGQKAAMTIDIPKANIRPFSPNLGTDDIMMDDIEFQAHRDVVEGREISVWLLNNVTVY